MVFKSVHLEADDSVSEPPVRDIDIEEVPIEDVIRQVFAR